MNEMELFKIICILLIFAGSCHAEDLIFFADDHYKSLGHLEFNASVTNPALVPGEGILRISLANTGRVEELIPISGSGSEEDILQEMKEEMHSSDAVDINAVLAASKPLHVTSGPQSIVALRAGDAGKLQFNITVDKSANGWYELPLHVDYVRQVDVSVSNGEVSPLFQSLNQSLNLRVFVAGNKEPLRLSRIESELFRGRSEALRVVIENDGTDYLQNCSARLLAAPPFRVEGPDVLLGDLAPGAMALAGFRVYVDANASLQDYQLSCLILSGEKSVVLALPLTLTESDNFPWSLAKPLFAGLIIVSLGAFLLLRQKTLYRRKRRMQR